MSRKPSAYKRAKTVVQWDVGQLVKFYQRNGWHYGRVTKIGRLYTTVTYPLHVCKLTHDQISTDV